MSKIESWVPEENLQELLRELSLLSGKELHPDLELYLVDGIKDTNGDVVPEEWFMHEFEGSESIVGNFAIDQGTGVLRVKLSANPKLKTKIETTIYLIQKYVLS